MKIYDTEMTGTITLLSQEILAGDKKLTTGLTAPAVKRQLTTAINNTLAADNQYQLNHGVAEKLMELEVSYLGSAPHRMGRSGGVVCKELQKTFEVSLRIKNKYDDSSAGLPAAQCSHLGTALNSMGALGGNIHAITYQYGVIPGWPTTNSPTVESLWDYEDEPGAFAMAVAEASLTKSKLGYHKEYPALGWIVREVNCRREVDQNRATYFRALIGLNEPTTDQKWNVDKGLPPLGWVNEGGPLKEVIKYHMAEVEYAWKDHGRERINSWKLYRR